MACEPLSVIAFTTSALARHARADVPRCHCCPVLTHKGVCLQTVDLHNAPPLRYSVSLPVSSGRDMQRPIFSHDCSQLPIGTLCDLTSISYSSLIIAIRKASDDSSTFLWPASRMDQTQYLRDGRHFARLRSQQSSSSIRQSQRQPHSRSVQVARAPSTSPLPQSHWDSVPLPYRPRDWDGLVGASLQSSNPVSTFSWRLRPASKSKPSRRPAGFREVFTGRDVETQRATMDLSMLYPQLSPYADSEDRARSDPSLDTYRRAFSQPNTPNFDQLQHEQEEEAPSSTLFARAPTFPPSRRRRDRRATAVDTTFADDEDFCLFAQATAGLEPEDALRQLDTNPHAPQRLQVTPTQRPSMLRTMSEQIVSPVEQTPTTIFALQSLAQMPEDLPERRHLEARRLQTQQLQASVAGINLWLDPPSATSHEDVSPIDEELPDYAASQAQAHAIQRAEAARRAAELRRRWEQSR